jgi:TonB-dependent receptor
LTLASTLISASVGLTLATAASAADDELEEVVVTGVRASLLRSMDAKRNATTIVDAISAEELGKFPDRNVAEALGNIPGVTVGRDGRGEGRNITVRGLGEDFSVTTLNGRILPTDTTDRSFAFDILPSEMISGAEVMKAVQASATEGSIGGSIDLRTARPLDNRGTKFSASLEGDYGDLPKKTGYKAGGIVSTTFADNTMGALLSATYSKSNIRTDNMREYSPAQDTEIGQQFDFNNNGSIDDDGAQYIWPLFYSNGVVLGERRRLGLSGTYQFQPSEAVKLTVDALYSHYNASTSNYSQSNFLSPRNDLESPIKWDTGSVRTDANGVVTNFSMTDTLVAEVLTYDEPRVVNTYQAGANLEWQATDALSFVFDGYQGEARHRAGGKNRFVVAGITDSSGVFATRGGDLPDLQITIPGGRSIDQATDADYRAHYIGIQGDDLSDRITGLKLSGKLMREVGALQSIEFGAAWTNRRKIENVLDNSFTTACNYCGYPFTFGAIGAQVIKPFPVSGLLKKQPGNFPRSFAIFDIDTYLAALPGADNNSAIIDPNTGEPYPAGYSTQIIALDGPLSYRITEKTSAGFVQANFGGDRWHADAGVRLVHTNVNSNGATTTIRSIVKRPGNQADFDVQFNDPTPTSGGGSYTKVLPSVNYAWDFTAQLRLRLAAAQVLSRPTFAQLSPASDPSAAQSGTFILFDAGNPNLKPTTADQFDASLEYYESSRMSLSAAVFYKRIKNFASSVPVDETVTPTNQPPGEPTSFDFTRVMVVNGDSGRVLGAELGGQYFFANGFGVQANTTFNHSRANIDGVRGKLEGAIPYSSNLKLFYEANRVSTQVSWNHAARYTVSLSGLIAGLAVKETSYDEVSASFEYAITESFKAYVEGSNLLNDAISQYNTYRNVPAFYESSGRAFFFGVRSRF